MNIYQQELQTLRPHDEIQSYEKSIKGYFFIGTAGHGYLVVPKNDPYILIARDIAKYGYVGKHAVYLEEDCEVQEFINQIKNL